MKKNQIICTLPLPEVAKIARKSPRTIRRWCQLGLIKGARCSRGGHWKVRICISGKDEMDIRTRARKAGGRPEDFERELWDRTQERVWDLVAPASINRIKPGFERHKKIPQPIRKERIANAALATSWFSEKYLREPVELATMEKAEELFAASEWAESQDIGVSLGPIMGKIREWGFMPIPKVCFTYVLDPSYQTAFEAAGRDHLRTAMYGAALNVLKSGKACSVQDVCRRIGISRATAYRKGVSQMVTLARNESGRDFKKSASPPSASADDLRKWNSVGQKNTVHRDPKKRAGGTRRQR